jgi:Putative zinc finger motif, C2HC5-type
MNPSLQSWASPRIKRLLPLDDESLLEILNYSTTLSKIEAAEHLKNLLGYSPAALDFISTFNNRRPDLHSVTPASQSAHDEVPRARKAGPKNAKPPLHSAGPVRRPEGYGDIVGGYQKDPLPDALQVPKVRQGRRSPTASRQVSPSAPRLPPSAAGNLISEFMPNVRSKQPKKLAVHSHSGSASPQKAATTTTSTVADLTSAIAALELATNPTLSSERRKCDCNATIHPLFATAPNCLNCGKVICALEGLQPCSFCDTPVLAKDQVDAMIKMLKEERGAERMAQHNAGVAQARSGTSTPLFGARTPGSAPDSGDEAARARLHRDKLLSFQRENAQRTKIHDEAADYDATLAPGATQWMSPVQRAAALKKQQQYLRELDESNRPEWEKKRTVMSIGFRNGKLVKTYGKENTPLLAKDGPVEEIDVGDYGDADHQRLSVGGSGAFSNNPLLKGGKLIRPMWKPAEDSGKGKEKMEELEVAGERKSVWRRVQDDYEDNEEWILDGGLRGFGTETRLMEDGSQQECG